MGVLKKNKAGKGTGSSETEYYSFNIAVWQGDGGSSGS